MKTKKLLAITIILLVVFSSFAFFGSRSKAVESRYANGVRWNYEVVDGKAVIISIDDISTEVFNSKTVTIPSKLGTYTVSQVGNGEKINKISFSIETLQWEDDCEVTTIGKDAFYGAAIRSIVIPDSVTRIEDGAFQANTRANSLQLGSNLEYIGKNAFSQVAQYSLMIESLVIPDSVKTIDDSAFRLSGIKNLTIGNGVETIGEEVFLVSRMENVTFGNNIKTIGKGAFSQNNLSGAINIPSSCTTVGEKAFYQNKIQSVTIPNSVTSIGVSSFEENNITGVNIGTGITEIPELAFAHNELPYVTIPGNIRTIGKDAFRYNKLTAVALNEGLKTIGEYAFAGEYDDPSYNQISGTVTIPNSVTSIGKAAFIYNKIETLNFGTGNPTIGDWAFQYNSIKNLDLGTGLQSTGGSDVFADNEITSINFGNVKTISEYAFSNAFGEIDLVIPGTVETINRYAFRDNTSVKSLVLNEGTKTIMNSAFYGFENCKGDLTIPNSVTTLGSSAFAEMKNLDGVLTLGTGVNIIESSAFYNMRNVSRINVPSNVTKLNGSCFSISNYSTEDSLGDVFIDNTEGNVTLYNRFQRYIHWRNETHNINIDVLPGVHILNAATGVELTSGDYACESDIDIKVKLDEGYTYSELVVIVEDGDEYETLTAYNFDESGTYDLVPLTRNRRITVQSISSGYDLLLRTYISRKNNLPLENSREPVVEFENGDFEFKHAKTPVLVAKDDIVTYTIRVYNQGLKKASADRINVFIPEGLELVTSDFTNILNGWEVDSDDSSKIYTTKFSNRLINGYTKRRNLEYVDIVLNLKVTKDRVNEVQTKLNIIAEIGESSCIDPSVTADFDSSANITAPVDENYKAGEASESTSESYVKGQEDDDDFESVILPGKVKITYDLHLRKTDIADEELLEGATFRLYNERKEKITDADTNGNGEINFGTMTSYGEGQDIYYMEEIVPPARYAEKELCKIKVIVNKTIINELTGECAINIVCEKVDYRVDTSRFKFVPVTTKAELAKIGSGETVTINGKDYEYSTTANYKLMNDIDLSGSEWTPIENEVVGIFDGNEHKITGLTITSDGDYNKSEVGLFRVFSGIFENTTFENVNININNFASDAANISGKTGVGTIAGVMREGVIYKVTISGTVTANVDNVGGFVGHTMPERIVRAIECTNNAAVSGKKNVGGVIGCSLGAVSMVGTKNTGAVKQIEVEGRTYFDNGNAGGLVGYVESTDYQETLFTGAYKEDDESNLFTLVARNEELENGTYKMLLENRDASSRELIPNGVYTVYDSNKSVITGLENITLTDGTADLGTYTFKTVGKTTYYLKENSPATGYRPLTKYIKVVVTRAWDGEEYKFYVTVEDVLLSDEEFTNDIPEDSSVEVNPKTGKTNEITEHEDVYWNVNKAEFIDCNNTANIGGTQTYHAGGLLGTACKCHVEFDNCSNSGTITGRKVAGLAANIACYKYSDSTTKIDLDNWSKVINCRNTGAINELGLTGVSGGLVGEVSSNIKVYMSTNTGSITVYDSHAGGIIGKVSGKTQVISCRNDGEITSGHDNGNSNNDVCGGIIGGEAVDYEGKYSLTDKELLIVDCKNTANIKSDFHVGGIIGILNSDNCIVKDCTVENPDGEELILESNAGNIGGIVANIYGKKVSIRNCNVNKANMSWIGEGVSRCTYGDIGGIVANLQYLEQNNYNIPEEIVIDKCTVENSKMDSINGNSSDGCRAGIIGKIISNTPHKIDAYITNCTVRKTDIMDKADNGNSMFTLGGVAGIIWNLDKGNIELENCFVDECNIKTLSVGTENEFDTAGIIAVSKNNENTKIINCDVRKSTIVNGSVTHNYGGNDNAAGIIAYFERINSFEITDCDVYDNTSITTANGNIGGIVGAEMTTKVNVERCTFKGSRIDCLSNDTHNSNTGGIFGSIVSGESSIKDCEVDGVTINTKSVNTGGILGYSGTQSSIDNCTVNKTNITTNYQRTNYGSLGGIAGNMVGQEITNCTVSDCNLKNEYICTAVAGIIGYNGTQLIDNCKVIGGTIESDSSNIPAGMEDGYFNYNPFMVAGLSAINGNAITNSKVEGTTIKGGSRVSGFIGYGSSTVRDNTISNITLVGNNIQDTVENGKRSMAGVACESSATFENVKVNGITATGNIETFGGFVGGSGGTFKNCSVKNLNVTVSDVKSTSWGAVGGFAGHLYSNARLENVDVDTATIDVDEHVVGGLIGEVITYKTSWGSEYDSNVYVVDSKVKGATITHKNSKGRTNDGLVGGLVGTNTERGKINAIRCKVIDCNLTGNEVSGSTSKLHMGGIIGFVNGENSFANCEATGTAITNNTEGMTGGVAGMTQYKENDASITERSLVLDDVTVDGGTDTVTISGKSHVGGILGFGKINVTTPVTVKNLVLKTLGTTGDEEVHEVIGVATDHTGEADVTVENVTIE